MSRRILLVVLWAAGCGDNRAAPPPPPPDPPVIDAGVDAGAALAPCLDRPTELATAPTGALPCELLPPGWKP